MKTAGIIGGIAPESTIQYYRLIVSTFRERHLDGSYPPVIINSIDMQRMLAHIGDGDLDGVTEFLLAEVEKLARGGADFAVLASNTPHIVFDRLAQRASIPMISIVAATAEAAAAHGLRHVGLFGTRFTMQSGFYADALRQQGIALVVPTLDEQTYIHTKYMGELVHGQFLDATRARMLAIAARMRREHGIDGLVLGGTELPLILDASVEAGMPLLDTTKIHAERIVAEILT